MTRVGIIGGSGLDAPEFMENAQEVDVETPFGPPTSWPIVGTVNGVEVALLARHGRRHTIPPSRVNYRANVRALQALDCTHILATTAVGSLQEEIGRGDLVIVDQFIDFTHLRSNTFFDVFEPGNALHTPMADPFDETMRQALISAADELGQPIHKTGTVITIEGPRFSTRAESRMYRIWGADIVNMSIAPEASLANELKIPYAAVAMATDYDCWKEDEEPVSWDMILKIFGENVDKVTKLIHETLPRLG